MNKSKSPIAEIIAVGDEMTSGQRLDTNSQWLAQKVNELGIEVAWHSTVGDDLARQTEVFRTAMNRANIVLVTGGLGPTKDDLTRQAIAQAGNVDLEIDKVALAHIESIFAKHKRTMSPANRIQAKFPSGGKTIHNEEGTAPGVDFPFGNSRVFAMPGVPYEMKQMWETWVGPQISKGCDNAKVIRHHVLRCFGVGESQAESMMPDLISRDREPRVGITASYSIISFRITATGDSESDCAQQIESTAKFIRESLGDVVFGENDDELNTVTAKLLADRNLSVSFVDFQFGGAAAGLLRKGLTPEQKKVFSSSHAFDTLTPDHWLEDNRGAEVSLIGESAARIREAGESDIGVAIGRLEQCNEDQSAGKYRVAISLNGQTVEQTFRYGGHSSMRDARSANQVVNFLRLTLLKELFPASKSESA